MAGILEGSLIMFPTICNSLCIYDPFKCCLHMNLKQIYFHCLMHRPFLVYAFRKHLSFSVLCLAFLTDYKQTGMYSQATYLVLIHVNNIYIKITLIQNVGFCMTFKCFKWLLHTKMKILSLITYPHVVPNP